MNATLQDKVSFPVEKLPEGTFAPPLEPDHPTWRLIAPWTDPLADRGAYRVSSEKTRLVDEYGPGVRFQDSRFGGRALVHENPFLRDAVITCRLRPGLPGIGKNVDGHNQLVARAGLVFRMETIRRHYFFCLEERSRLVLYRRDDDDWHVLDWCRVALPERPVTLRVELEGDRIAAACPELAVSLGAEDRFPARGRCGYRSIGESVLYGLAIETSPEQRAEIRRFSRARRAETGRLGRGLPEAVPAGRWDVSKAKLVLCGDFHAPGRNDLLWQTPAGLEARTWAGEVLWSSPLRPSMAEMGKTVYRRARRLYLMAGERVRRDDGLNVTGRPMISIVADRLVILDGRTGRELVSVPLPEDPPRPGRLRLYDFGFENGFGTAPGAPDFIVRQWRAEMGDGGVDIWVYDRRGNILWHRENETVYGHHGAVHFGDFNRDGAPEIIAGGTCLDIDGRLLWTHDRADEMRRWTGAHHYDSVLVPPAAEGEGDRDCPATGFFLGGSAGVYAVDLATGRTRATWRVGHAQFGAWARLRDDLPGPQCLVGTRWGNYGTLTLFSREGEKIWTVQPDYVLQGSCPVRWCADGPEHYWVNTSANALGLYDGRGRLVKPLPALREFFDGRTRLEVGARALRPRPGGRHWLALEADGEMALFRPEDDA